MLWARTPPSRWPGRARPVASLLGCQPECVYFTSGGSEANNLAIFGAAGARARLGKRIVTTAAEHSSVSGAVGRLEGEGWDVVRVRPDAHGQIDARAVADAVDGQTALVSMMYVNNETGAVFPVERAARLIRAKNPRTLIHCDGVQAFGKLPVHVGRTEIDLMSVSGHKICAPKGSGALYIRRGVRVPPLIFGGGQERGMRAGTENLPAIAALGAACAVLDGRVREHFERACALRGRLLELLAQIEGVRVLSPPDGSPYITCLSVPGYRSETMLHFLESRGVFVSSGSACSKGASSGAGCDGAARGRDRRRAARQPDLHFAGGRTQTACGRISRGDPHSRAPIDKTIKRIGWLTDERIDSVKMRGACAQGAEPPYL